MIIIYAQWPICERSKTIYATQSLDVHTQTLREVQNYAFQVPERRDMTLAFAALWSIEPIAELSERYFARSPKWGRGVFWFSTTQTWELILAKFLRSLRSRRTLSLSTKTLPAAFEGREGGMIVLVSVLVLKYVSKYIHMRFALTLRFLISNDPFTSSHYSVLQQTLFLEKIQKEHCIREMRNCLSKIVAYAPSADRSNGYSILVPGVT